jgi:TrmH family RNA methyltransferase
MHRVTSHRHPIVKLALALAASRGRRKEGLIWLEGLRACEGLAAAGPKARAALFTDRVLSDPRAAALAERIESAGTPAYRVPDSLFDRLTHLKTPQGVALLVPPPVVSLAEALRAAFVVVADRLQDPGNLGTLLRSARAFGAGAVVTTRGTVDAGHPRALRAAAGAWPGFPLCEEVPAADLRDALVENGRRVLVADPRGTTEYRAASWTGRIALVLGSEAAGADPALLPPDAERVRIPLAAGAESLNVTAAAAVLLAEAAHRRADSRGRAR